MTTTSTKKERGLPLTDTLLILFGAMALPAAILLPFLIHSSQRFFVITATPTFAGCQTSGSLLTRAKDQCVGWERPGSLYSVAIALIFSFLLLAVLTVLYAYN